MRAHKEWHGVEGVMFDLMIFTREVLKTRTSYMNAGV